jgi:hypothetical protein
MLSSPSPFFVLAIESALASMVSILELFVHSFESVISGGGYAPTTGFRMTGITLYWKLVLLLSPSWN